MLRTFLISSRIAAATLLLAATGAGADNVNIEPLSNGNLAASMKGCSVLYDATGKVITQGSTCTREQLGTTNQAIRQYLQSPSGGGLSTLSIDRVDYGAGSRTCSATSAVAASCSGRSTCSIRIDNSLCGDPASGTRKEATISYRCGGHRLEERVSEGETINLTCAGATLPDVRPTRPSRPDNSRTPRPLFPGNDQISVQWVEYGSGNQVCDATRAFEGPCSGRTSCRVSVDNDLCGDPARGTEKSADIEYRCGAQTYRDTVREGETAELDCSRRGRSRTGREQQGLTIEAVEYGYGNDICDATRPIEDACSGRSSCRVRISNDLCGDPARGRQKQAEIYYRCNSRSQRETVNEGDTASLRCR